MSDQTWNMEWQQHLQLPKQVQKRTFQIQNQAARMMTGAITTTGPPTMENRQNIEVLTQAAQFKRFHSHPMHARMNQQTKRRLKRSNFIHQSTILEKKKPGLLVHEPQAIPPNIPIPSWKKTKFPVIKDNIPGIENKRIQADPEQNSLTVYPIQLPSEQVDPCLHRWVCHCSNQRRKGRSVYQVQRRGIKHLIFNWKVPNKLPGQKKKKLLPTNRHSY